MNEPTVIDERQVGTVAFRLVRIAEPERYIMTLVDKWGIAGTLTSNWPPAELVIEQAIARHVKLSQVITKRN